MNLELNSRYDAEKRRWEVAAAGEVDVFSSDGMRKTLAALLDEKNADLVIDCGKLQYIDSTALGVLVETSQRAERYGGNMIIKNPGQNIMKLLRITNLDKVFKIERAESGNGADDSE